VESSPAIGADGTIYFGSGDFNLYALTDGGQDAVAEKWAFEAGPIETSSPAIGADGTIYIGSNDGATSGMLYR
jgi:outer membrane protein assembly factor BamB